jgi:hypothetical protein
MVCHELVSLNTPTTIVITFNSATALEQRYTTSYITQLGYNSVATLELLIKNAMGIEKISCDDLQPPNNCRALASVDCTLASSTEVRASAED